MSLDYNILSQIKTVVSVPVCKLRVGDVVNLPKDVINLPNEESVIGKIISMKTKYKKNRYKFSVLLANREILEVIVKEEDNIDMIV